MAFVGEEEFAALYGGGWSVLYVHGPGGIGSLRAGDAQALLGSSGVPAELLAFAGSHPLELLLGAAVAGKDGAAGSRWMPNQDVVATLLDQLMGELRPDALAASPLTRTRLIAGLWPGRTRPQHWVTCYLNCR